MLLPANFPGSYATDAEWVAAGIPLPPNIGRYQVTHVEVIGPLTLSVRHIDGVKGTVRFEQSALRGVFAPLQDAGFFARARAEHGAVRWSDDVDISPDNMHRHLHAFGGWVIA